MNDPDVPYSDSDDGGKIDNRFQEVEDDSPFFGIFWLFLAFLAKLI